MKICNRCKAEKAFTSFPTKKNGSRNAVCRTCMKTRKKQNKALKEEEMNKRENLTGHNGKVEVIHINQKWTTQVPLEEALLLFEIGCAKIVSPHQIVFSNIRFLKDFVLKRDANTCAFCSKFGDTVDHLLPKSRGGCELPSNFITACRKCNELKASMSVEAFLYTNENRLNHFRASGYYKVYETNFEPKELALQG